MKRKGRKPCLHLCMMLIAAYLIMSTFCNVSAVDASEQTGSIQFDYDWETPDINFDLYYVADVVETGTYAFVDAFQSSQVDLVGDTDAANTLAVFAKANEIEPNASRVTDNKGVVKFEGLKQGVYLLIGGEFRTKDSICRAVPVVVEIPCWDEQGKLNWDVEITGKCDIEPIPAMVKVDVVKVWKQDKEDKRPKYVTVQLLRNGKPVAASEMDDAIVKLSADNNWTYRWENLDKDFTWSVQELSVPDGYTVSYQMAGSSGRIVIVNTGKTSDNPPTPSSKIPQTGQLWWPVLILVCGGLLMLIIGFRMRKDT